MTKMSHRKVNLHNLKLFMQEIGKEVLIALFLIGFVGYVGLLSLKECCDPLWDGFKEGWNEDAWGKPRK